MPLFLFACKPSKDGDSGDSGVDPSATPAEIPWLDDGTPMVAPPVIDWLADGRPTVAPPSRTCPAGWAEDPLDDGGHLCDPWPSGARAACDPGSMMLPGTDGCTAVGSTCPGGTWPGDVSDVDTWFVATGGTGDGSRNSPFGSLSAALAAAAPGDTIVLGEGAWAEHVSVTEDVTIRGLCPSLTSIVGTDTDDEEGGMIEVDGAALTLSDVTLSDAAQIGILANAATVSMTGVVIDGVSNHGISAADSAVTLADVLITGVLPRPSDDANGDALYLTGASPVVGEGVTIADSHRAGMWAEGSSSVDFTDLVVFGMEPQASDDTRGVALRVAATTGTNTLRRVVVEDVHHYVFGMIYGANLVLEDAWIDGVADQVSDSSGGGAVLNQGPGSVSVSGAGIFDVVRAAIEAQGVDDVAAGPLSIEDVVIRGVRRGEGASFGGVGVLVLSEDTQIARLVAEDNEGDAVYFAPGSTGAVTDVVLRRSGLLGGFGSGITSYGDVTLDRAILLDAPGNGIFVPGGGSVVATDVYVSSADAVLTDATLGAGVSAEGGNLTLSRALIEGAHTLGINSFEGAITAEDCVVRDVLPHPVLGYAIAVNGYGAADARSPLGLRRVQIENAGGSGITGTDFTLDAQDVTISGVTSLATTGQFGFGIDGDRVDLALARVSITDVQEAGIWIGTGTLAATDLLVSRVTPQSCVVDLCPDATAAVGVFIGADATGTLTQALLEDAGVGLQVTGAAEANDVMLRGNEFGYDDVNGSLTFHGLSTEDNGADQATEAQAVPTAAWE